LRGGEIRRKEKIREKWVKIPFDLYIYPNMDKYENVRNYAN